MRRVMLFDKDGAALGELSEREVTGLELSETVNGEHKLTIRTTRVLEKGWRIVTQDARGKWREHVVYGTDSLHDSGQAPTGTYYCTWSLQAELMGTQVSAMPGVQNPVAAGVALRAVLEGTDRWEAGTVAITSYGGASMYDMSGWKALSVLLENWGGEVDVTIEVGQNGVTARKVDYYSQMGEHDAKRRFDFGADLKSVRRKLGDGPLYCRISPRGKGEQVGGGYGRKITISSVNQGKDYLQYAPMVELAKLPDGNGGWEYPTLIIENSECDTPAKLKEWAQSVIEETLAPKVTYTVDVLQLAREGVDMHGVSLGDKVHVVDSKLGGVRVSGRVVSMVEDLLAEEGAKLVIGYLEEDVSGIVSRLGTRLNKVSEVVQNMNGGDFSTAGYLSGLLERLNAQINALGGYTYITEGQGLRTYDRAVSDPLVGDEADSVVEIKGGTVRIANSRTAQGEWDWKTVFTSGNIAADLVTAAHITAGYIGSAGDTYIDLDGGTVQLGPTNMLHALIDNNAFELWTPSDTRCALHLGYGLVRSNYGEMVNGPYFTLGERKSNTEIGFYSYSEGEQNEVSRAYSHSEGYSNEVTESYSHAEGYNNDVSGRYSHAEGANNVVSGTAGHVGGNASTASGDFSFAHGQHAVADNDYSQALGYYVNTGYTYQLVCGKHNAYDSGPFVVGYGTNVGSEKNVLELSQNGNLWIAGTLTQNSDKRLKSHLAYLDKDAYAFVSRLKPAVFVKDGKRRYGFYAQDVQAADPWDTACVEENPTDNSLDYAPLTLDYTALIAPLVAYAQSLEKRIEALEEKDGR